MSVKPGVKILDLLCMLPIVVISLILYTDGLDDFMADNWTDFGHIEASRSAFYVYPWVGVMRPTKFAFQDFIYQLFGPYPVPYHTIILCLHLVDCFLVFAIVKKIIGNRIIGLLAALLFATSWLHPDALIWTTHDVIVAFSSMCCLVFFYKYRLNPTWSNYLLSLLAFVMAIGSKEPAVIFLPSLLYLTDRYITLESQDMSPEINLHLSKKAYLPFLLISLAWLSFVIYIFYPTIISPADSVNASMVTHLLYILNNLLHSVTFCFAFPLFSELPRFGIINLTLVVLFYFFSPIQLKRRLLLLMIAMVIVYLPTSLAMSPTQRFLYLSSVFGMAIFATMLYYGGIQLSRRMRVSESLAKFIILLYVFLLVSSQLSFVNKQMKYYNRTGHILNNLLKAMTSTFPKDTLNTHLIFVNFPDDLKQENPLYYPVELGSIRTLIHTYYESSDVGQVTEVILSEVYSGRDTLLGKNISVQEFEELAKDKGNTVYFFNPKDDSVHNVTGKDYNFLKKLAGGS